MSDNINDFTISLESMYKYLTDIDNIRSLVNITQSDNKTALKTLTQSIDNIGNFLAKIKADNKPTGYQESRVSAFCRAIGFPVISRNGQYFNPGYDKTKINKDDLYNIIANQDQSANDFFDFREQYYNATIKSIQSSNPINQNVFNLQMVSTPEMFDVFKNNGSYKVYDTLSCQYNLPQRDFLNNSFTSYNDASGNAPALQKTNYHFIYPLVTDGRVELTLKPNSRTTLVPFVRFDYNTTMAGTKLERPMLESIIKDRFFVPAVINANSYVQGNVQTQTNPSVSALLNNSYLSLSTNSQVIDLYNQLKNTTARYADDEVIRLSKFIYTLELLIDLWLENQKIIEETMSSYYWLPTCINNVSPEFGVKSNPLFGNLLSTALDNQIIQLNARKDTLNLISNMSLDTVSADQYIFSQFRSTFSPDQLSGYKSILQQNVDDQMAHRTEQQKKAEAALQNIEIICGGISGLGLIDIIVIISSLYMMDKNNLLGFLDADAYSRAQDTSTNIVTLPSQTSLDDAYLDLETQIGQLYQFVSSTYNMKNNNI